MRFGKTLRNAVYPPWQDHYIEYGKLKGMLREDDEDDRPWTEEDENKFCDEILNTQVEKVADFQASTIKTLEERTNKAGEKLRDLSPEDGKKPSDIAIGRFKEIEEELDAILNELKELQKYSNINYTGFFKIVKKHDRKRGNNYKIRPMMQMTLSKRPFNSDQGYSPLLNKVSMMYFVVKQYLDESVDGFASSDAQSETQNGEKYTAHKFWIHPENLLEVKTFILRRLPALVYSEQSSKGIEAQGDPTLTSLYFDSPSFPLYTGKVERQADASSLRLRWFGQLNENPELYFEQKVIHENGTSEEKRFTIKQKYIAPFIKGEYKMEKSIQKMERQGQLKNRISEFKDTVESIQKFILDNDLQPVLRANYTRTAFQKPADDKVRISIDTSLAFIREDSLDPDRPCRNPDNWHRLDLDNGSTVYPFTNIGRGEISRFPFSVLEIKVKDDGAKKQPQWIEDLMASHLVYKAPRFSKFVHGVASLFEDHVNNLPFWTSVVDTDIRKDPETAFQEEEERKAKKAETDLVIGSLMGTKSPSYKAPITSPVAKSYMADRLADEEREGRRSDFTSNGKSTDNTAAADNAETADTEDRATTNGGYGTVSSLFPSFSLSRYAQARREKNVVLPEGVTKPTLLIKDSGPLQVEPKVWLANERTFLKWQHICILLGGLAVGLYTAAGEDIVAEFMGIAYIIIAIFAGAWGYYMHITRRNMIVARSGKDFDNMIGPMVVSFALMVALILNFVFKYQEAISKLDLPAIANTSSSTGDEWVKIELV